MRRLVSRAVTSRSVELTDVPPVFVHGVAERRLAMAAATTNTMRTGVAAWPRRPGWSPAVLAG